jgi:hypothetical protein
MAYQHMTSLPERDTFAQVIRAGLKGEWKTRPDREPPPVRADGRHILRPMICDVSGAQANCEGAGSRRLIKVLHNAAGLDALAYPMSARDGWFFSEALDASNPWASDYLALVGQSLAILGSGDGRAISLKELMDRGREIQRLDEAFANARFGAALDSLHQCMGPDAKHPYAKITICRTTLPVEVGGREVAFFFEKFLVSYSYLDERGQRRSTLTPIHSHPLNFETAYFTSFGRGSRVVEQEFLLVNSEGVPLVGDQGAIDPRFFQLGASGRPQAIHVQPGPSSDIPPSSQALRLAPFDMEVALRDRPELALAADGLFRPHQVTVLDDDEVETRYFALDNYFGPIGRVILYQRDGSTLWDHDDWS